MDTFTTADTKEQARVRLNSNFAQCQLHTSMRLDRIRKKLGGIIAGTETRAAIVFSGDSITRSLVPDTIPAALYREYGFKGVWVTSTSGGYSYGTSFGLAGGAPSGGADVTGQWTVSLNGYVGRVDATGEVMSFFTPAGLTDKAWNRATVVYRRNASGGTFRVQYLRGDSTSASEGNWIDIPSDPVKSAFNATENLVSFVVDMPIKHKDNRIRVKWESAGTCDIIGTLLEDTDARGLIIAYGDVGGMDMNDTNTMPSANLAVILGVIQPDLVYWSMKDGAPGVVDPKLVTWQALWDSAYLTEYLFSAPYPDSGASSAADALGRALPVINHAIATGHDYWNPLVEVPDYPTAVAQGYMADTTHFNSTAAYTFAPLLWRTTGLLPDLPQGAPEKDENVRIITAATAIVNGLDVNTMRRQATSSRRSTFSGLRLAAATTSYVANQTAEAAIGTGAFTLVAFVRVPANPVNTAVFSLRSTVNASNQASMMNVTVRTTDVTISTRDVGNTTNTTYSSNVADNEFWLYPGEVVMVAVRRDVSGVAGVPALSVFIGDKRFAISTGTAGTGLEAVTGQFFIVGTPQAAIMTENTEIFGAARYDSALSDTTLITAARNLELPSGLLVGWAFNDNSGRKLTAKSGTNDGVITGTYSWINPSHALQTVSAGSTLTVNGDLTVEPTSNTLLTFKYRGTDGTTRSGTLTLS